MSGKPFSVPAEPGEEGTWVERRHWRVVNNETDGISYSTSDREMRADEAAIRAGDWCDGLGADRYHVEAWVQTFFVGASDWRQVDE